MFKKRKSPQEVARTRIEEREYPRRIREGEELSAMVQAEKLERDRLPEPGPCRKHPGWNVRRERSGRGLVQPWPSASECPECSQARATERQARREYVVVD